MKYLYIFAAVVIFSNIIISIMNKDVGSSLGWITAFCMCMAAMTSIVRHDNISKELEDYKKNK